MTSESRRPSPIKLWPDLPATHVDAEQDELDENGWFHNVSTPKIVPFLPTAETANGTCFLICPGGSYRILDWVAHVERLAALFNPMGYAVLGLKYRTISPDGNVPRAALDDLQQALCVLRDHVDEWGIDCKRIVGLGYSAGSNLLLNHACSPPVLIDGLPALPHMALLCLWPNGKFADDYSVTSAVPNTFLCTTEEDQTAPAAFSLEIAEKLRRIGAWVSTTIYPHGDHHAFDFESDGCPSVDWTPSFLTWLKVSRLD